MLITRIPTCIVLSVAALGSAMCESCDEKHILWNGQCVVSPECYKNQYYNSTANVRNVLDSSSMSDTLGSLIVSTKLFKDIEWPHTVNQKGL